MLTLADVLRMAEERLAAGDARGGLDIYRQILAREPENPNALLGALRAAQNSGDAKLIGAALRDLEKTYGTAEAAARTGTAKAKLDAALKLVSEAADTMKGSVSANTKGAAFTTAFLIERYLGKSQEYFSQSGQDQFLATHVFAGQRNGVFVDVGSYNGVEGSNTLHFEKFLNWTGLCIEPDPTQFEKLKLVRYCPCIQTCIADKNGTAKFLRVDKGLTMMGGLVDHMNPGNIQMVQRGSASSIVELSVRRLDGVLAEYGIGTIDYLSIDTEGSELSILRTLDLSALRVRVVSVENNLNGPDIPEYMRSKGYNRIARIGVDDIYARE